MGLTALATFIPIAIEGRMVALFVNTEMSDRPSTSAPELMLNKGEGVLCKELFELGVTFHFIMILLV